MASKRRNMFLQMLFTPKLVHLAINHCFNQRKQFVERHSSQARHRGCGRPQTQRVSRRDFLAADSLPPQHNYPLNQLRDYTPREWSSWGTASPMEYPLWTPGGHYNDSLEGDLPADQVDTLTTLSLLFIGSVIPVAQEAEISGSLGATEWLSTICCPEILAYIRVSTNILYPRIGNGVLLDASGTRCGNFRHQITPLSYLFFSWEMVEEDGVRMKDAKSAS
ncbi:hypothetical protein AAG570_009942 [Ranatra chinensis]|uniref:Uncharacterized protein n=1 Tax=Ranatra chinensis TaxID=642074 RepID=A0ABD0Z7N1_9HEMI